MTDQEYRVLVRTLPRMIRELIESNTVFYLYLGALVLCVGLVSRTGRLLGILLSTVLGPILAALVLVVRPLNPYDNLYAKKQGISLNRVRNNESAQTLVQLLRSPAACRRAMSAALILMCATTLLGCLFGLLRGRLAWTFNASRDPAGLILTGPLSLGIEATVLLRWAMQELKNAKTRNEDEGDGLK
jgi:hypothetical protein